MILPIESQVDSQTSCENEAQSRKQALEACFRIDCKRSWTIQSVKEHWDATLTCYDSQASEKVGRAHERRYIDCLEYFNPSPGDRVLNTWSRTGRLGPYLKERYSDIRLVQMELSELVTLARKKYPDESILQGSLHFFPFKSECFDWVFTLETLEHCPSPRAFLYEINRVLKPGGLMVLSCPPFMTEPLAWVARYVFGFHGEGPHRFLSSNKVKGIIKEAGFTLLDHKSTVLIPCGPDSMQKFGQILEPYIQRNPLGELCIRQFFYARKE
jgi:ubiquinone/menaquinone biosynthesis C-methylase UbiE